MGPRADAGLLPGGGEEPQPSGPAGKTLWLLGDAEPGVWGPRPCTTGEVNSKGTSLVEMFVYGRGAALLERAEPMKSDRGLIRCVSKDRGSSIKDRDGGGWDKP